MGIERGTCRFVAKKDEDGCPTITPQFFRETVSVWNHAARSFDLLGGLTLEQAAKLADALDENILDASPAVSSEPPMFTGRVVNTI